MSRARKLAVTCLAVSVAMFVAGCAKKVAPQSRPPAAPAPVPVPASPLPNGDAPAIRLFEAEPTAIQRGQSATLRWEVTGDVVNISVDQGIGKVQNAGNQRVFPSNSITYTLAVTGTRGATTASATVRVISPPPPLPPSPAQPHSTFEELIASKLQDAYFDYDSSDIRSDAGEALTRNAAVLKSILNGFPDGSIMIEGHCDERGSAEYNLGIGEKRAGSAKDYLVRSGVPADRLKTISYGKELPQCTESNESCWKKNRRAHFSSGQ
jgi:peptidoglycan-associated lipoprotein